MAATIQVIVHTPETADGDAPPEILQGIVTAARGPLLTVRLRESPEGLSGLAKGDTIRCLKRPELRHPLLVTEQYLRERTHSYVTACEDCGFPEAFEPPTVLAVAAGLDPAVTSATFTAPCPLCEGTQMVRLLPTEPSTPRDASAEEVAAAVARIVADHFGESTSEVESSERIADFGGDDLDAIQITFALEAHFVVCIPDDRLEGLLDHGIAELTARLRTTLAEHRPGELLDLED